MPRPAITSIALLAAALLSPTAQAQGFQCRIADEFNDYNATKSYPMPGLQVNTSDSSQVNMNVGGLIEDPSETWYITNRMGGVSPYFLNEGLGLFWLNTGSSNVSDMGVCVSSTLPSLLGTYYFSKEVLERSVDDNGDCRTMLGGECVDALREHYKGNAQTAMLRGSCPISERDNQTLPEQCRGLTNGADRWLGTTADYEVNLDPRTTDTTDCNNDTKPLNASMYGGTGQGDGYNNTIRFPALWIVYFWPNRTGSSTVLSNWINDVHVEVRCTRPDEIADGSVIPPTAEELLNADGVEFADNATTPEDDGGPPESAGTKVAIGGLAPYVGAAVMAGLMLV